MKLNERMKRKQFEDELKTPRSTTDDAGGQVSGDPLAQLKIRAQEALFAKLGARLYDASLTADELQNFVGE